MESAQPSPADPSRSQPAWAYALDAVGTQFLRLAAVLWSSLGMKIAKVGEVILLFLRILKRAPWFFINPSLTIEQLIRIGTSSLPLVIVISFFIGAVSAVQAAYQFRGFVPSNYLGTAVCKLVVIESGPVLTALVLAGRVGSAIAAQIGTMKEKEELDAMTVLDLDPLRYLALPRILSGIVAFPLLVIVSDFLSIVGGWIISTLVLKITTATYVFGLRFLFMPYDVVISMVKAMVFGIIVVLMGYYHGLNAGAGAKGVGQASMKSVVSSCMLILIVDFLIVYIAY
jgi:phospholipid/cholesterol/gamma-HCH transport system permease protein